MNKKKNHAPFGCAGFPSFPSSAKGRVLLPLVHFQHNNGCSDHEDPHGNSTESPAPSGVRG